MVTPKTVVEKVQEKFKTFVSEVLGEIGEIEALALIIDWRLGRKEFPPGFLIQRNNTLDPGVLLTNIEQLGAMMMRLQTLYLNAVNSLQDTTTALTKQKNNLADEIDELKQQLGKLEEQEYATAARLATSPQSAT